MSPEELRTRIRSIATQFTDEVIAVFAAAFAHAAASFSAGPGARPRKAAPGRRPPVAKKAAAPVNAKNAAPVKAKKAATVKARTTKGKRIRRSADQLVSAGNKVIKLLASNKKGMRIEAINKAIGTSTRELMRPILKLIEEGKIKKSGERRATMYFLG